VALTGKLTKVVAQIWEDDSGSKCDFRTTDPRIQKALVILGLAGAATTLKWAEQAECQNCDILLSFLAGLIVSTVDWINTSDDDLIGFASLPEAGDPFSIPWKIMGVFCSPNVAWPGCEGVENGSMKVISIY
ncbi:MAG: hypothetical protein ACYC2K_16560, partial [Gemmatimonadales bacterium]